MGLAQLAKKTKLLKKENSELIRLRDIVLSPDEIALRDRCEGSLYAFIKTFWHVVEGDRQFYDNWHIRDIPKHLEAALDGLIHYLIINIPIRCMKSLICNVFFPAWVWINRPHYKIFCITGDKELALRDSANCKRIITSDLYQRLWGERVKLRKDINTISRYATTRGGVRLIKSIGGNAVGHGGDIVIIDDINRQKEIEYKNLRELTNRQLRSGVLTRNDNAKNPLIVFVMQRLHEEDAAGMMIEMNLEKSVHLMLPMEFVPHRACKTIELVKGEGVWRDPRTHEGELLWKSFYDEKRLAQVKTLLGSTYTISAQLQQDPTPEAGQIFKKEWFNIWNEPQPPGCVMIIQSWDTALSTSVNACESACTTWGIFEKINGAYNIILLNCWSGKLEQPELRRMIVNHARNYHCKSPDDYRPGQQADMVFIEACANGAPIIQDLKTSGIPIFGFNPRYHGLKGHEGKTNKPDRARLAAPMFEQGLVWFPARNGVLLSFAERVFKACIACPTGRDQDIVDSLSQAFIEMKRRELVYLPSEQPEPQRHDWKNDPDLYKYMSPSMNYTAL